jgi:hypothetical protein
MAGVNTATSGTVSIPALLRRLSISWLIVCLSSASGAGLLCSSTLKLSRLRRAVVVSVVASSVAMAGGAGFGSVGSTAMKLLRTVGRSGGVLEP